jgi:hypothetical protein
VTLAPRSSRSRLARHELPDEKVRGDGVAQMWRVAAAFERDQCAAAGVSPSISSAHPVASSTCFVECASVKMRPTKNVTNSG